VPARTEAERAAERAGAVDRAAKRRGARAAQGPLAPTVTLLETDTPFADGKGAAGDVGGAGAERAEACERDGAGGDGRAAGVGVGGGERERAGAGFGEAAGVGAGQSGGKVTLCRLVSIAMALVLLDDLGRVVGADAGAVLQIASGENEGASAKSGGVIQLSVPALIVVPPV